MEPGPFFFRILADLTVVIHFAYVTFVIVGLALTLVGGMRGWNWVRNPWFRGIHLAMILIVVAEAWLDITCPLTIWEQEFRGAAGQETYQGDFIATWLHEAMFLQVPPWGFTLCYTGFGAMVLVTLLLVPPRRRKRLAATS